MNWWRSFLLWSLMTCLSVNISFGLYFQTGLGQRSDDQTELKHLLSRTSGLQRQTQLM